MEELFVRARLPIEVLALSFNILSKLVKQQTIDALLTDLSLELIVLSTLSLASIHTNDHPPSRASFARRVSVTPTSAKQINQATITIMSTLDWRVHDCSEGANIVSTLRLFERRQPPLYVPHLVHDLYDEACMKPQPLCFDLEARIGGGATWANGQMTPGASSSCSVGPECENAFLPLL